METRDFFFSLLVEIKSQVKGLITLGLTSILVLLEFIVELTEGLLIWLGFLPIGRWRLCI